MTMIFYFDLQTSIAGFDYELSFFCSNHRWFYSGWVCRCTNVHPVTRLCGGPKVLKEEETGQVWCSFQTNRFWIKEGSPITTDNEFSVLRQELRGRYQKRGKNSSCMSKCLSFLIVKYLCSSIFVVVAGTLAKSPHYVGNWKRTFSDPCKEGTFARTSPPSQHWKLVQFELTSPHVPYSRYYAHPVTQHWGGLKI